MGTAPLRYAVSIGDRHRMYVFPITVKILKKRSTECLLVNAKIDHDIVMTMELTFRGCKVN